MPTSGLRRQLPGQSPMQWAFPASYRTPATLIGPWSYEALGEEVNGLGQVNFASATYPAASRVIAYPFELADNFLVQKVWWINGTTAGTDSHDCGVYSEDGATLIVSGGSTTSVTANRVQEIDCTDTMLLPGRYWCAFVNGGTTATPMAAAFGAANLRAAGAAQMAGSGSTLGSTFTAAAIASNWLGAFGIARRTQVA